MKRKVAVLGVCVTSALVVIGCATSIQEQWSKNITQLGIVPVYPPRESIYVGQVYYDISDGGGILGRRSIESKDFYSMVHFASLPDISSAIPDPAAMAFDKTQFALETSDGVSTWDEPNTTAAAAESTQGGSYRILRQVVFPAFTMASLKAKEAGINIPTAGSGGQVGAKVAASSQSDYTVSVKVPAAESYSALMMSLVNKLPADGETCTAWTAALKRLVDGTSSHHEPEFILVSEVYYARSIDVDIASENQNAFVAGLTTRNLADLKENLKSLEGALNVLAPSKPDTTAAPADGSAAPADAADALTGEKRITAKQAHDTLAAITSSVSTLMPQEPGVTTSIVNSSGSTITMRSTFKRPVAIGYRGIRFALHPGDCKIALAGPAMVPLSRKISVDWAQPFPPEGSSAAPQGKAK